MRAVRTTAVYALVALGGLLAMRAMESRWGWAGFVCSLPLAYGFGWLGGNALYGIDRRPR